MAIIDVVKYNGGPNVFAWKYPSEQLGTWTQLIVNESQEAVLYITGQALDLFTAGRHTLSTDNIPILNKIINIPFGGRSPFTAEVWYVNKIHSLDIKWGTPSPIQLQDPKYNVFVPLRAHGQFGIQVDDSKLFLTKLVGTLPFFDSVNVINFFKGIYLTKVKDTISSYLIRKNIGVLEINAYLNELSEYLKEVISPVMDEYGVRLLNFQVNDINVPDDDPVVKNLKSALSKRAEMDIVGYNYAQERSFDTLEGAATNQGSVQSDLLGAGIGLAMGLGVGGAMGANLSGMAQNLNINEMKHCPRCNADMAVTARFCPDCGYDTKAAKTESNTADDVTKCSNCGSFYSRKFKFCPECGTQYNPCPFCGADMKKGSSSCPGCGKPIPKHCPNCGALIEKENTKFCPECGTKLS